jgi:hypothetical protein
LLGGLRPRARAATTKTGHGGIACTPVRCRCGLPRATLAQGGRGHRHTAPTLTNPVAVGLAAKTAGQRPTLSLDMVGDETIEAFSLQARRHGAVCVQARTTLMTPTTMADDLPKAIGVNRANQPRWVDDHRSQAMRGRMCDHSRLEANTGPPCVCQGSSRIHGRRRGTAAQTTSA